ncbi:MAG: amidohydrolase family protein [Bacteroidetes bacterium]|nr:amidohydrolase family protein [Bacteroidota bacterium]
MAQDESIHQSLSATSDAPIINCHTHIFTGDHVAPLLAKSTLQWPLYYLVNFKWIFWFFRRYYRKSDKERFNGAGNLKARKKLESDRKFKKSVVLFYLYHIAGIFFTIQSLDILCHWIFSVPEHPNKLWLRIIDLHNLLVNFHLLINKKETWMQVFILTIVILFYKSGRNLLMSFARLTVSVLKKLPGKKTKELYERYLTIGRFAFHTKQLSTLKDLEGQYPDGTRFVILPMDMEFMDAGQPAISYKQQMEELAAIAAENQNIYPFVFVDPRRIANEGTAYFNYSVLDGKVVLENCFIKDYIEGHIVKGKDGKEIGVAKFYGFKIYPALGYYPFHPLLLPLWKYAEQEGLPILTHCVRGPMYFRGKKERSWDYHPIFEELIQPVEQGTETPTDFTKLLLPQSGNDEFSANFTHPMNFLCLLKKEFFIKAVEIAYREADDSTKLSLKEIFGFRPATENAAADVVTWLNDLKICIGHYGGGDEWNRYFEKDRFNHSAQLVARPDSGIDFIFKIKNGQSTSERSLGKTEQLWKYTDWYSIISSMMLQHKNVYADISYILHDNSAILPLLKQSLLNKKLRGKILYGTDFFVVRNHKSDKNMLADMMGGLDKNDFDQIARINPVTFLNIEKK